MLENYIEGLDSKVWQYIEGLDSKVWEYPQWTLYELTTLKNCYGNLTCKFQIPLQWYANISGPLIYVWINSSFFLFEGRVAYSFIYDYNCFRDLKLTLFPCTEDRDIWILKVAWELPIHTASISTI